LLDKETTAAMLGKCHAAFRTEPVDLYLAAVISSFAQAFPDRQTPTIFDEGHGREMEDTDLDISRTVGWFTTLKPIHVPVAADDDMTHTIKITKDRRRQLSSWNGHKYLASRVADKSGEVVTVAGSAIEILFNYEGQYQQLEREGARLKMLPLPAEDVGKDVRRFSLFEISSVVKDGQLHFTFGYNKLANHQDKIQQWVKGCSDTLQLMAQRLTQVLGVNYTLSDFPLMPFDYQTIDEFSKNTAPGQLSALTKNTSVPMIEDVYPCAPMQQGVLLSQAKEPLTYAVQYMWLAVTPEGNPLVVDIDRMRHAWEEVVRRHVVLRTVFLENLTGDGLYGQVVLEDLKVDFQVIECGSSDPVAVLSQLPKMLYQLGGLQHKLTVCTTPEGHGYVQLDVSHSIIDGGSVTNIAHDLAVAYSGQLDSLPTAPSYRPFVEYIQNRDLESDLAYWKNYLADAEPTNFPHLAEENAVKELHKLKIDLNELLQATNAFCSQNHVTLFNLFQAAWALVLRAYTRSDNVLFGHLTSGRDTPIDGIQDAVGTFIKMIVCLAKIDSRITVREVIEAMATNLTNSLGHQDCTLMEIQNVLGFKGENMFTTGIDLQHVESGGIGSDTSSIRFNEVLSVDPAEVSPLVDKIIRYTTSSLTIK
jgi:non-ribosomal peptide synthase protein (TIGR01720 family)